MKTKQNQCAEFPYFGANYPDATCIDGRLWDLDSDENGKLTIGGEEPCPFCKTEEFLFIHADEDNKEEILKWIERLRNRYEK